MYRVQPGRRAFELVGVVTAIAIFLLAGCGPQGQDEDDVPIIEDEEEQVYIFPDGTTLSGEEAAWVREVKDEYKLGQPDAVDISREDIEHVYGPDTFLEPPLPERFHFLGYSLSVNEGADFQRVAAAWVAPYSREFILLESTGNIPRRDQAVHIVEPLRCDTKKPAPVDLPNPSWAKSFCRGSVSRYGLGIAMLTINVPNDQAGAILKSLDQH